MIMFSGLSFFVPPAEVVACLSIPLFAVNLLQGLQYGVRLAVRELTANWLLAASLCIFIALAAPLVTIFPSVVIFAVLGSTISFAA